MAGRITLWGAEQFLKSFFGKTVLPPDIFYLALVRNTPPSPYISGMELEEPTENYARIQIPNNGDFWNDPGQKQTIVLADEVVVEAGGEWGQIRYWALCNAAEGGYLYACGSLESPQTVATGDNLTLTEGDLVITLGPFYTGDF